MQAVIFAAGNSTRMYPLTVNKHKGLLKVAGKRLVEHQLDALDGLVDEVIFVISPANTLLKSVLGDSYNGLQLTYVAQAKADGTAYALKTAQSVLKDRFICLMGDDLYSKNDVTALIQHAYAVLAAPVPNPEQFGVMIVDDENNLVDIIEKPLHPQSNLISTGAFVLDTSIFKHIEKIVPSHRNEYELGDAVKLLSKEHSVRVVEVNDYWLPCSYPWDLLAINEFLFQKKSQEKIVHDIYHGVMIDSDVHIHGYVDIGEGSVIKNGSRIEGPVIIGKNCVIGPHAHIIGATSIGDNCTVGFCVQVKNSIIGDNSKAVHHAYIGDSVIGENVNFGNMTTTSNWRHDEGEVKSMYKGQLVGTGRTKFGAVIGDNVKLGCNTVINPGRKLWPFTYTVPNEVVSNDKGYE